MSCIKATFIKNGIKKETKISYFDDYERSLFCKNQIETLLYTLNYDYTLYNSTLMYFNGIVHLLNQIPSPYPLHTILNKIVLHQPVNTYKTCFIHMFYNNDNHLTIIIEERALNKMLEIIFYDETIVIPLIH